MPDLITLEEFRASTGRSVTDTRDDARFTQLAPYVSAAIRSFTERDFGAPIVTEERIYEYDGSGYLDIDDASDVQSVSMTFPNAGVADQVLPVTDWTPKPQRRDDAPVYHYIAMGRGWGVGSPEMGFERNLDVWVREHPQGPYSSLVKVTATFGWPVIPGDVKMAAVWTMQAWLSRPSGQGLTSEAIEGWSRTWGSKDSSSARLAIPDEARDVLVGYSKGM